jgi:hypothetical protein
MLLPVLQEYNSDSDSEGDDAGSDDVDEIGRDEPLFRDDGIQDQLRTAIRRSNAGKRVRLSPSNAPKH